MELAEAYLCWYVIFTCFFVLVEIKSIRLENAQLQEQNENEAQNGTKQAHRNNVQFLEFFLDDHWEQKSGKNKYIHRSLVHKSVSSDCCIDHFAIASSQAGHNTTDCISKDDEVNHAEPQGVDCQNAGDNENAWTFE